MKYLFYRFPWVHMDGENIVDQNHCYYASKGYFNIDDMRDAVKKIFSLDCCAVIVINGFEEISQNQYEHFMGKPFIPTSAPGYVE